MSVSGVNNNIKTQQVQSNSQSQSAASTDTTDVQSEETYSNFTQSGFAKANAGTDSLFRQNTNVTEIPGGGGNDRTDWSGVIDAAGKALGGIASELIGLLGSGKNLTDYSTQNGQTALNNVNKAISTWGDSIQGGSDIGTRNDSTHGALKTTGDAAKGAASELQKSVDASNKEISDYGAKLSDAELQSQSESQISKEALVNALDAQQQTEQTNQQNINAGNQAVTDSETVLSTANQGEQTAGANETKANENASYASKSVTIISAKKDKAMQNLSNAATQTTQAEKAHDQAKTDHQNATSAAQQHQSAVTSAEGEVSRLKGELSGIDKKAEGGKEAYNSKKAELSKAESKLKAEKEKQKELNKAEKKAEKAEAKAEKAEAKAHKTQDKLAEKAGEDKEAVEIARNQLVDANKQASEAKQAHIDAKDAVHTASYDVADKKETLEEIKTAAADAKSLADKMVTDTTADVKAADEKAKAVLNAKTDFQSKANAMQEKNNTVSQELIPQLNERGQRALDLHAAWPAKQTEGKPEVDGLGKEKNNIPDDTPKTPANTSGNSGVTGKTDFDGTTRVAQNNIKDTGAKSVIEKSIQNAKTNMAEAKKVLESGGQLTPKMKADLAKDKAFIQAELRPGMNDNTLKANPELRTQLNQVLSELGKY